MGCNSVCGPLCIVGASCVERANNKMLIKRINVKDRRYLRNLPSDTQGQLHGLFVVRGYTGEPEIQRVWRLQEALSILGRHQLYHVAETEFSCEYKERNWNGLDVTIRLRIRICPAGKGFAKWLLLGDTGAWDNARTIVYAPALEAVVQTDAQYGLASYVRTCLERTNPNLLKDRGAESWPNSVSSKLRAPWLEVVSVDDVKCLPHTATVRVVDVRPGTVLSGQYKLIKRLGQGGMGQVWEARDEQLNNKTVAVKILAENADPRLVESIKNEADVLSGLSHHNIATMRGYHKDGNVSYMVIDFIKGHSLEEILLQDGKLAETRVLQLLRPVAEAIDYVHDEGLVHRDVKPANIMVGKTVSSSVEEERTFLCDFGIASKSSNVTQDGWGTPGYCAPEVASGAEVTVAADVFSFAVTIYQCLTDGRCPFGSRSEVCNKALSPLPDTISFGRMVMQGLSKDPDRRPKKCVELFDPLPAVRHMPSKQCEYAKSRTFKSAPPVKQQLDGGMFLEYSVLRDYRSMLRNCGMDDAIKKMNNLVKYVKSRDAWHVMRAEAFLDFIKGMPAFADVVQEKNMARASRHNLKCWFDNKFWPGTTGPGNVRAHYGNSEFAILNAIYDSITRSNLEN